MQAYLSVSRLTAISARAAGFTRVDSALYETAKEQITVTSRVRPGYPTTPWDRRRAIKPLAVCTKSDRPFGTFVIGIPADGKDVSQAMISSIPTG